MRPVTFAMTLFAAVSGQAAESAWVRIPAGAYTPFYALESQKATPLAKEQPLITKLNNLEVPIRSFSLQRDLVTNADYLSFVNAEAEWQRHLVPPIFADQLYLNHWPTPIAFSPNTLTQPITHVSWFAAKAYCQWLGARLPTTDEWEYVAMKDDSSQRDAVILAWYAAPVATTPPLNTPSFVGSLGIRDMYGKVWEWTLDFNSALFLGDSREDQGLASSLFCGAGSIGTKDPSQYATFMRFAFRSSLKANYNQPTLGFRCAKD